MVTDFAQLGIPFPWDCRRLSRQILTELNIAQLQVIVNDLHTQIEGMLPPPKIKMGRDNV